MPPNPSLARGPASCGPPFSVHKTATVSFSSAHPKAVPVRHVTPQSLFGALKQFREALYVHAESRQLALPREALNAVRNAIFGAKKNPLGAELVHGSRSLAALAGERNKIV
jgi:hypothetical protein